MTAQDLPQSAPPAGGLDRLNAEGQPDTGPVRIAVVTPTQK